MRFTGYYVLTSLPCYFDYSLTLSIINMLLLIVDDDDDDRGLFCEAILRIDPSIRCLTATDGKEAYDLLTELTVLPDIVFMDINMPVMDGKTCLTLVKGNEDLRDIPIVMWSTTMDKNEIEQLEQLGADFLSKPYNFEKLVETLSGALTSKGLVNK